MKYTTTDYKEIIEHKTRWIKYYLDLAQTVSSKSKDPSSKVGCVLSTNDYEPISMGYNGFPKGCAESHMSFERPIKYHLTLHAEINAIHYAKQSLKGAYAYITHAPCDNCLLNMAQKGISAVWYKDSSLCKRFSSTQIEAIKIILKATGIYVNSYPSYESYASELDKITKETEERKDGETRIQKPNPKG